VANEEDEVIGGDCAGAATVSELSALEQHFNDLGAHDFFNEERGAV